MTHFCCDAARYYISNELPGEHFQQKMWLLSIIFFFLFFFFTDLKKKNSGRRLFPSQFCSRFDNNAAVFFNYLKKKINIFPLHSHDIESDATIVV